MIVGHQGIAFVSRARLLVQQICTQDTNNLLKGRLPERRSLHRVLPLAAAWLFELFSYSYQPPSISLVSPWPCRFECCCFSAPFWCVQIASSLSIKYCRSENRRGIRCELFLQSQIAGSRQGTLGHLMLPDEARLFPPAGRWTDIFSSSVPMSCLFQGAMRVLKGSPVLFPAGLVLE